MNNNRVGLWIGLLMFFLAAIYSSVLFFVKISLDASAWVLYIATLVAFLLTGIQVSASSRIGSSAIMDSALGIVTMLYFGIQFVFGGIVLMCFSDLPFTPVVVAEIILLAIYLGCAILMRAAQSSSISQAQQEHSTVQKLQLWESDVQSMADAQPIADVKQLLQTLAEALHYCDKVTSPALAELDENIGQSLALLRDELADGSADPCSRINAILMLLKQRERTAAICKH